MPIGYPDWQKIQQWIGAPIASQDVPQGVTSLGPYNVASWRSLLVQFQALGGGGVSLGITWQRATAGAISLQQIAHISTTSACYWVLENAVERISNINLTVALAGGARIIVSPCNLDPVAIQSALNGGVLLSSSVSVGAGATQVVGLPFYGGRAKLIFNPNAGTWTINGIAYDYNLNLVGRWYYENAVTTARNVDIVLPPAFNRLELTNNGAAPITYTAGIIGVRGLALE